jgi:hypothetical protein
LARLKTGARQIFASNFSFDRAEALAAMAGERAIHFEYLGTRVSRRGYISKLRRGAPRDHQPSFFLFLLRKPNQEMQFTKPPINFGAIAVWQ